MSKPGCYRGVCVALKLHHLAVAAVDTAPQLAELSGALTLEGLLGPAAPTFKVLRELVQVSRQGWGKRGGGGERGKCPRLSGGEWVQVRATAELGRRGGGEGGEERRREWEQSQAI
jgi:hypothetical protein